jgi:hypothetical protein
MRCHNPEVLRMRVAILPTVFLFATVSFAAHACARNQTMEVSKPITNSPAARQTETSQISRTPPSSSLLPGVIGLLANCGSPRKVTVYV